MRGNPGNLRQAAAAKSAAARARAEDGLRQMRRRGDPITFRGLAQTAGVSLDSSTGRRRSGARSNSSAPGSRPGPQRAPRRPARTSQAA